uniref:PDZ domain-containing protein n=2 Tax=Hemiselmis andersenii TaxID=464988 RepID=A0A7S1HMG5_HEMAN|mmetsp:Transcript_7654/g.18622  ORF Transcript_7654/g.18622 Transcript_7654/m.18622 type:complete len:501 (+) Transcript_7654:71-1573(+)|eukprot:CAMPEP_0114124268 /NCGR_PEP_ID=MMETSP0043_2-20121206/8690_1 /TAXON_ID=464988 /ORGANISM="Hemiselmis andersenii, Strain CCMP644" /LENGTH=500 /DNA_ID=CAMNT_0001217143 /DNA_START=20 /DNA_END=1522 /DNA_ORIENTATION=-
MAEVGGGSQEDAMAELKKMFKADNKVKERVVKGSNLWQKKFVTVTGERIAKVDRVAAQMAKFITQLRDGGVPLHHTVCVSEYLKWSRSLCALADSYVSSEPVGVGLIFAIDSKNTAVVDHIEPGSPAAATQVRVGDQLVKIDGQDLYQKDYLDMAQAYLGRKGTTVTMQFKRPDQPHPITATMRRAKTGHSSVHCDLHPTKIVERTRFMEKSLVQLRFQLEEWGDKDPAVRLTELFWHRSVVESELGSLNHRCLKLSRDLGLDVTVGKSLKSLDYDRGHVIRDPFAQMVWVGYFSNAPCCKLRDFLAAVQNELRNLGFRLLHATESSFLAKLMGTTMEDCVSQYDIQSLVDHWNPPPRWGEVETFPWDQRGHGLMDAFFLAKENLLRDQEELLIPDWFHPFLQPQEICHILSTADPGTFAVSYSIDPGDFVVRWTSAGRQTKSAKVFVTEGGYAWRADGKIAYPTLQGMLREVSLFLNKGMLLPAQRHPIAGEMLSAEDD